MKRYTKAYFEDKNLIYLLDGMKTVDDGVAIDNHFLAELYKKTLEEKMKQSEDLYNKTPEFLYPSEKIDEFYEEHKFPKYDLSAKRAIGYMTKEEANQFLKQNEETKMAEFESRPAFDETKFKKDFLHQYQSKLLHMDLWMPKRYLDKTNPRLVGLGYLPASLYQEIKKDILAAKERLADLESTEEEYQNTKSSFSPELQKIFFEQKNYHLFALIKEEKNLNMYLRFSGLVSRVKTGEEELIFSDVSYISQDDGLPFVSSLDDVEDTMLLKASELYQHGDTYEGHFLLEKEHKLYSFIISFKSMKLDDNFIYIKIR